MTTDLVLPSTSNPEQWDEEERALMASAGLVHRDSDGTETVAPRSVVASFLYQCARSKLDPHARQIYLIARKNKGALVWTTQVSIDGFRVIAERTGHYVGQGDVEWLTPDGKWVDVWLPKYGDHPAAARATVYRDDFATPMRAIAHWDSYVQTNYKGDVTAMWRQHGPGQIAKCAEALALRKAFPQDLSSLYTVDEMQQAENGADGVPSVTSVRDSGRNPGHTGNRGHASETRVTSGPEAERTPTGGSRPRPPRPVTTPGTGRATPTPEPTTEQAATIAEFVDAITETDSVNALRVLHDDADKAGLLAYPTANGVRLNDLFHARKAYLQRRDAEPDTEDVPLDIEDEVV